MYKTLTRYTLLWSFALGVFLAVMLYRGKTTKLREISSFEDKYNKWFTNHNLKRRPLSMDFIRYGNYNSDLLESRYLYKNIRVICVLLVRKRKNASAANATWAKHCNERIFIYLQSEKRQKTKLPIRQTKLESSWHLLCDAIRRIKSHFEWALFLNDDTFALVENVRYMVAGLDPSKGHYLGHPILFWGVRYNVASAGYLLSRGSVQALQRQFNSSSACLAGGRFWKQEDFYLGKHLAQADIFPSDSRDSQGLATFHGYNLQQLLFPGSLRLANYYKFAVYTPTLCCSPFSVTFQTVESDKMYTNYYLLYQLQVFESGRLGNKHALFPMPDDYVWKAFIRDQGLGLTYISPEAYYDLWKSIVNDPVHFNQNIRNWSLPHP